MSIENLRCADATSRKVFTEYEYELKPVGFHLPSRRTTIYVTVDGTRRAYEYPFDNMPRIRSPAHPFFALLHAREYTFDRPPCRTFNRVRDLTNTVVNITKYWMRAPPDYFIYGPDIAIEHRHPRSIAGSGASKSGKPKTHERSKDRHKAPKTKQVLRAREARKKKSRPRSADPPTKISGQQVLSLGKRERVPNIGQSSVASPPRPSSQALAAISADDLYTGDKVRAWMRKGAPACNGGQCSTLEPPLDVAAGLVQSDIAIALPHSEAASALARFAAAAFAHYASEPSREPEETLRTGKRFKRGIVPLMQVPDTSRFCSNDWAQEKFRVHLWAPYDPQNTIHF
ncbi:hypothetical protein EV714DRAFT_268284 [Schizophyllum commune]